MAASGARVMGVGTRASRKDAENTAANAGNYAAANTSGAITLPKTPLRSLAKTHEKTQRQAMRHKTPRSPLLFGPNCS